MSKILKNTTLSDYFWGEPGINVPASGQVTIPFTKYLEVSQTEAISEITADINSGDIVVNDGTNDLSYNFGVASNKAGLPVQLTNPKLYEISATNETSDTYTLEVVEHTGNLGSVNVIGTLTVTAATSGSTTLVTPATISLSQVGVRVGSGSVKNVLARAVIRGTI